MIEENEREQDFIKKVDDILAKSIEIDYPPQLHKRALYVWTENMGTEKSPKRYGWLGYASSLACAGLIALFAFSDVTPNEKSMKVASVKSKKQSEKNISQNTEHLNNSEVLPQSSNNSAMIATNMIQDDLEDVSDEEIGVFYDKLKKFRENSAYKQLPSAIYMPTATAVKYSTNR